jgi:hypothetical protein
VILFCEEEQRNWSASEKAGEGCISLREVGEKYEEVTFIRASWFSNDSSTAKFIHELESRNDSIRREVLSAQQLSHLMKHKIEFIVNGVWLEHDAKESLFPFVSIRNSTGNETEVLYLDCSLADINLQFLDLFDFTSSFVFWCYVVEGICVVILMGIYMKKEFGCPPDIEHVLFIIILFFGGLSLIGFDFIFYFLPTFSAVYLNFYTNTVWTYWTIFLCL